VRTSNRPGRLPPAGVAALEASARRARRGRSGPAPGRARCGGRPTTGAPGGCTPPARRRQAPQVDGVDIVAFHAVVSAVFGSTSRPAKRRFEPRVGHSFTIVLISKGNSIGFRMGQVNGRRESWLSERRSRPTSAPGGEQPAAKNSGILGFSVPIRGRRDCPHRPSWRRSGAVVKPSLVAFQRLTNYTSFGGCCLENPEATSAVSHTAANGQRANLCIEDTTRVLVSPCSRPGHNREVLYAPADARRTELPPYFARSGCPSSIAKLTPGTCALGPVKGGSVIAVTRA
jgi:hypothetical protein